MKYVKADLLADVVGTYDQTKTTIQGRAFSKTVDSKTALGPPLNKFLDVITDATVTPAPNAHYMTPNGRVFVLQLEATGIALVALYTFDYSTGASVYVGKVQIAMPDTPSTTHVYRSVKALDTGTTGWKLIITTTASTALINGGTFIVNDLALADFVPIGFPTIPFATGNGQKAVYKLEDPANTGAGHLQTISAGSVLDSANDRLYVHNGVSATHQYYVFDTSAALTYTTFAITGTEATNLINHAGHTFVNNDPVTFTALTGGAGFTITTQAYFVVNSVPGVSYQLSATSGGAAINFTTDISAGTIGRAFGTSHASFLHKTGNLPALTGTLLITDSEDFAQPQHGPLSGFDCVFLSTNSALYLGKLSELTVGAVTWPSLATVNLLGAPNQIIAPATTYATWSNALDRAIYTVGTVFVIKSFVSNAIEKIFGGNNNRYFEGLVGNEAVEFQPFTAITGMDVEDGWIGVSTGSTGQRGIFLCDLRSDAHFDHSFIVTKVLSVDQPVLKFLTTLDALYDYTGSLEIYYRTSGFGSISGGWTAIPFAEDLTAVAGGTQIQFKILFSTIALDTSIHAQLCEFILGYESLTDNSDKWELSVDDSDNGNPSRTAFRLKTAYASVVPTLYYRALDLTDVALVTHNTVTNAARFEYSTNGGVAWNALGTIPNTVGTLVRYTFSTPPGVDIRPSLRES